jgi:hypothetical protein
MDGSPTVSSRATFPNESEAPSVSNDLWTGGTVAPQWHPKIAQFFLYWRRIHPAAGLPGRQHFDPLAIHALLPGVWLLDFQREPFRLRYRLIGTEAVEAVGAEVTGRWMDEVHGAIAQLPGYLDRYRAVVEQKLPSWRRGTPRLWTHKKYATLENILVPLASDGTTVDMLAALTVFHSAPYGESDSRPQVLSRDF